MRRSVDQQRPALAIENGRVYVAVPDRDQADGGEAPLSRGAGQLPGQALTDPRWLAVVAGT